MTFCKNCNFTNLDDSIYCENCGSDLGFRKNDNSAKHKVNYHSPDDIIIKSSSQSENRKEILKIIFLINYVFFGAIIVISIWIPGTSIILMYFFASLLIMPLTYFTSNFNNNARIGLVLLLSFLLLYSIVFGILVGIIYFALEIYLLGFDKKVVNLFQFQFNEKIISLQ